MKLFRVDSPLEEKLQKVEALLNELGLSFEFDGYQLTIIDKKQPANGFLIDAESFERLHSLPRFVESERIGFED